MAETIIVVPCYDEEERLDVRELLRLARAEGVRLVLVNDGSTDGTKAILEGVCERSDGRAELLSLERNSGKAEAVRRGLNRALETAAPKVGYTDADLATPVDEVLRLSAELDRSGAQVVMGARVALSGRDIARSPMRHYLGRVFATFASVILRATIYDTQCGAKFFRSTDRLRAALEVPFVSGWAFDVELLGRLLVGTPSVPGLPAEQIVEVPLRRWHDVRGSKVTAASMAKAGIDLARIALDLHRRRIGLE